MGISAAQQAFVLVCGAGMSTLLGGAFVFNKKLVNIANNQFLAGVTSFSAGVMLFVSMMEIFVKSHDGFLDSNFSESNSFLFCTLSFFGGILIYLVLERIALYIEEKFSPNQLNISKSQSFIDMPISIAEKQTFPYNESDLTNPVENNATSKKQYKEHLKTGIMLAIAISIHNIPEGLATFVAALADPVVGASLAIGIGIHNIPEGMCVAMPMFYATNNRWQAFRAVIPCALAIPAGGALGWLILKDNFDDRIYGIVFGMVSGMMTIICLKELIPVSVRNDLKDKVTTKCVIGGMAVMASSLVCLLY